MAGDLQADLKRAVGERAAMFVEDGMVVGLGTGSTAVFAIESLGARARAGLRIRAIPTSRASAALARARGIPLTTLNTCPTIDVTIDGADEVDPAFDLIKGRGGALLREKIVASATRRQVIIVDESKLVTRLGERMPVPVEVVRFGWKRTARDLEALGLVPTLRLAAGRTFVTDNGNFILDSAMPVGTGARDLAPAIKGIIGVVDHGFFIGLTHTVVVGGARGVEVREKRSDG